MNSLHDGDSIAGKYLRRWISMEIAPSNRRGTKLYLPLSCRCCGTRWFSNSDSAESTRSEFSGLNAYELLGVSETSSFPEIKASFRRLAKLTHPDLAKSSTDSDSSERFVQILAAYEILSDSEKRGHYDMYLFSQRKLERKKFRDGVRLYKCESRVPSHRKMEVAEWLKWYRFALQEILLEKRVVDRNGYFDELERDFYSAVRQAYYGPAIDLLDYLPDRFEAEERSIVETHELLHLVSGRDLFGMVCLTHKVSELAHSDHVELESSASTSNDIRNLQTSENVEATVRFDGMDDMEIATSKNDSQSQAFADLELQVYGRAVAVAKRISPKNDENDDRINIYLNSDEYSRWGDKRFTKDSYIGSITGLRTSPDEGSCFVYDNNGTKTHVIVKHRTLLVKHMHWYGVGEEVSACECRCSRARLPPSKFWLFEPRCAMHDIGGWYIETFGRDKKGRTVLSQRYWDGFDPNEQSEKRLHPAMYLLALAYRTLDLEDARSRKRTIVKAAECKLYKILNWCKKNI